MMKTLKKFEKLKRILTKYPGVVIAFSGGVDSSLLLKISKDILENRVIAVTAISPIHPKVEIGIARKIVKRLKCRHITIQSKELKDPRFFNNPKDHCYYCKMDLFKDLKKIACQYNYAVIEGSNKTDLSDYRPGFRALKNLGIDSPFIKAGIGKREIRMLAKKFRLPNWNKPSMTCLASRIPYGRVIDRKILGRIESAERYLKRLKLIQVRVRDYYPTARIEVSTSDMNKIMKQRIRIIKYFKKLGYQYITLDLEGYRTGSLNP